MPLPTVAAHEAIDDSVPTDDPDGDGNWGAGFDREVVEDEGVKGGSLTGSVDFTYKHVTKWMETETAVQTYLLS